MTASFQCIFRDWMLTETISEFAGKVICFHTVFHSGECIK